MTLLIGKLCTDGVLFLADGISISENLNKLEKKEITARGVKTLCGARGSEHYCLVFGGHAGLNTTRQTIEWLREAVSKPEGSLQDNVELAAQEALRDAITNGFKEGEDDQRTAFLMDSRILVFISVRSYEWWCVSAFPDHTEKAYQAPGFVVISLLAGPDMKELLAMRDHSVVTWREAVISCGRIFDRASELFPEGCRYPGTLCVHTASGCVNQPFSSFSELAAVAAR